MKKFTFLIIFFLAWSVQALEKRDNQILLACAKVNDEFVKDLNLNIPKKNSDSYILLAWDNNEEPFNITGDNRFISPAKAYIFNGAVHEFDASLYTTITKESLNSNNEEELKVVASTLYVHTGKKDKVERHGLFYIYNNHDMHKSIDYINSSGGVYQLDTKAHRNKECQSKFPGVNVVDADEDSQG